MAPRHISSSRAHSDKIPTATPMFQGTNFLVVVLPVSWDVDVCLKSKMAAKLPEVRITIQVLQIHMSPENNTGVYDYVRNIWMSNSHGRRYLVSKIQDGNQLTGSTDISETMTYTIEIPTTNLRHSTMANSQEVYLGDSNNNRQSETAAETGNTYISETVKSTVKIPSSSSSSTCVFSAPPTSRPMTHNNKNL